MKAYDLSRYAKGHLDRAVGFWITLDPSAHCESVMLTAPQWSLKEHGTDVDGLTTRIRPLRLTQSPAPQELGLTMN